jgi:hypothetical protein
MPRREKPVALAARPVPTVAADELAFRDDPAGRGDRAPGARVGMVLLLVAAVVLVDELELALGRRVDHKSPFSLRHCFPQNGGAREAGETTITGTTTRLERRRHANIATVL